jgi:Flp pilus assembly protein TadD
MPKAKAIALQALQIDDALAEAHTSLAMIKLFFDWDWDGAEKEFKKALALNCNYATAHHAHAALLAVTGRKSEAIAASKRALEIDPLSVPIHNIVGMMLAFSGHWDGAIAQYRKTIEMDPAAWLPHWNLGIAFEEIGKDDEAKEEYLKAAAFSGNESGAITELRNAYEQGGLRAFRRKQLQLDLARWKGWHLDSFHIAAHYALLNEPDDALAWLDRACEARSGGMVWIKLYPYFKNLYRHPHFQDLTRYVGLPA